MHRRIFRSSCPGKSAKRVFALDVPGIHVYLNRKQDVDGRNKSDHDAEEALSFRARRPQIRRHDFTIPRHENLH